MRLEIPVDDFILVNRLAPLGDIARQQCDLERQRTPLVAQAALADRLLQVACTESSTISV